MSNWFTGNVNIHISISHTYVLTPLFGCFARPHTSGFILEQIIIVFFKATVLSSAAGMPCGKFAFDLRHDRRSQKLQNKP